MGQFFSEMLFDLKNKRLQRFAKESFKNSKNQQLIFVFSSHVYNRFDSNIT